MVLGWFWDMAGQGAWAGIGFVFLTPLARGQRLDSADAGYQGKYWQSVRRRIGFVFSNWLPGGPAEICGDDRIVGEIRLPMFTLGSFCIFCVFGWHVVSWEKVACSAGLNVRMCFDWAGIGVSRYYVCYMGIRHGRQVKVKGNLLLDMIYKIHKIGAEFRAGCRSAWRPASEVSFRCKHLQEASLRPLWYCVPLEEVALGLCVWEGCELRGD